MSDDGDETRSFSPFDETEADSRPASPQESDGNDPTRVTPRSDATSVMPSADDDDWASSRAKPVWAGRAEVRAPQPGRASYDTDWQTGPAPGPGQRDRWWMPIVVGIVVLILLSLLGWGIYLIVQNSGDAGTPATTTPPTTAVTTAPTSAAPTAPSSEPTTTTPTPSPTTTEPTTTEVLVPALRGLSLEDARDALNQTGLRYRVLYRTNSAPQGTVIDSDPAEGQEVPPDTRVTIVVSGTDPSSSPSTAGTASAGN